MSAHSGDPHLLLPGSQDQQVLLLLSQSESSSNTASLMGLAIRYTRTNNKQKIVLGKCSVSCPLPRSAVALQALLKHKLETASTSEQQPPESAIPTTVHVIWAIHAVKEALSLTPGVLTGWQLLSLEHNSRKRQLRWQLL
ncbi:hypothetical protein P7K49_008263 [Saguinus oedipus]|uniref:Uncharacterized protein n=1 Tax=Saguinus oedipus TaxID=9490 RepID=A0ABQ9VXB2_SAGOE|nr:hypothetical protein P7K49_008263 [Saguinus oedipus]